MSTHYDVIIIGAGLSGICAGYHLKKTCPNKSFLILEGRERIGGEAFDSVGGGERCDGTLAQAHTLRDVHHHHTCITSITITIFIITVITSITLT